MEILEKATQLKKELIKVLSEPVPYPSDSVKQQVSKRCQALASFMESLLVGVNRQELKLDIEPECEPAASEHGSVMLGEISPHHHSNHENSKSSSETPISYNQLNYFENLNRFFNSVHPTFVPNEFKSLSYQIDHVPTNERDRMLSPIQQSGEESGGSFNSSSDTPQFEITNSNTSISGNANQPNIALTEDIVCRHTDQMELQMVKNHRTYRNRSNLTDKKKAPDKCQNNANIRNQSIKRSWPNELGNGLNKNSKSHNQNDHRYTSNLRENAQTDQSKAQIKNDSTINANGLGCQVNAVHLWPPFSVKPPAIQNNIATNVMPNSINQFLFSNHLSTPRCRISPPNTNGILKLDQTVNSFKTK